MENIEVDNKYGFGKNEFKVDLIIELD